MLSTAELKKGFCHGIRGISQTADIGSTGSLSSTPLAFLDLRVDD